MFKYYKSATVGVVMCVLCCSILWAQQYKVHNLQAMGGKLLFEASQERAANDTSMTPLKTRDGFALGVPGERPVPVVGRAVGDTLFFSERVPPGVFPGKQAFFVFFQSDTLLSEVIEVPNMLQQPGSQPLVENLHPRGTSPGRVVTVIGKGFGSNLDDIYIWFTRSDGTELPPAAAEILNPTPATYLTTKDANGEQELKFLVPGSNSFGDKLDVANRAWLEYDLRLRVVVKGQPSANSESLSVVREDYRLKLFLMVMALFAAFLVLVWGLYTYMHRKGYGGNFKVKSLVIDTPTNQYSLAKVQALGWTVILILSYMYYVLITFVILDRNTIPDFEPSLLILMGITTTGLLIARGTDRNQQIKAGGAEAVIASKQPSLWDLISENGTINLASLQLLLFTIVSMGVYILFMTDSNLVETGMPTMPTTLLGLMGISQGGYLTGKVVENSGLMPPAARAQAAQNNAVAAAPVESPVPVEPVAQVPNPQPQKQAAIEEPKDATPPQEPKGS